MFSSLAPKLVLEEVLHQRIVKKYYNCHRVFTPSTNTSSKWINKSISKYFMINDGGTFKAFIIATSPKIKSRSYFLTRHK